MHGIAAQPHRAGEGRTRGTRWEQEGGCSWGEGRRGEGGGTARHGPPKSSNQVLRNTKAGEERTQGTRGARAGEGVVVTVDGGGGWRWQGACQGARQWRLQWRLHIPPKLATPSSPLPPPSPASCGCTAPTDCFMLGLNCERRLIGGRGARARRRGKIRRGRGSGGFDAGSPPRPSGRILSTGEPF